MGEGNTVLSALLLLSLSWWCRSTPRSQGGHLWETITTPMWSFFLASSEIQKMWSRAFPEAQWGSTCRPHPVLWVPPQFFALCLPVKATLYLHKQHVERVAHQKQPAFIHAPERRRVLSPARHCDARYTENLFPLQYSKSYRKGMAPRNGEHHMLCNVLLLLSLHHSAPTNMGRIGKCKRPDSHMHWRSFCSLQEGATSTWITSVR